MKDKIEQILTKIHKNNYQNIEMICIGSHIYSTDKITFKCKHHGTKQIRLAHLVSGHSCNECASITRAKTRKRIGQYYLDIFANIHNNKYKYKIDSQEKIAYKEKIKIRCAEHGLFTQSIEKHAIGQGCPTCGLSFNKRFYGAKTNLYHIQLSKNNNILYKIGITRFDLKKRFQPREISEGWKLKVLNIYQFNDGKEAIKIENKILKETLKYKIDKNTRPLKHGNTEIRTINLQNLIEKEFSSKEIM